MTGHDAAALLAEPMCGMTWGWTGVRGTWDTPAAERSMTAMAEHGVTWTALAYAAEQATPFSTEIPFGEEPTVADTEIVAAIRRAHRLGRTRQAGPAQRALIFWTARFQRAQFSQGSHPFRPRNHRRPG